MFRSEKLGYSEWAVVIPKNLKKEADTFVDLLLQVSRGMKFEVGTPQWLVNLK